jgi:hypothetical protein
MARKPYKKDLTPLRKGGSIKTHTGKGAREQARDSSGSESLTGGDPYQSAANQYPKSSPEPEEESAPASEEEPPVPMGPPPQRAPTALMPPSGGGGGGAPDVGGSEDDEVA